MMRFDTLIYRTIFNIFFDVFFHVFSIKLFLNQIYCFVDIKMIDQKIVMIFSQNFRFEHEFFQNVYRMIITQNIVVIYYLCFRDCRVFIFLFFLFTSRCILI